MRILLVEDDDQKLEDLKNHLEQYAEHKVDVAHSAAVARKHLLSRPPFDFAILDMTLPRFVAGNAQIDKPTREGEELLEEIDVWELPTRAIIVSGYESFRGTSDHELIKIGELEGRLRRAYPKSFLGWVSYSATSQAWKRKLDQLLRQASDELRAEAASEHGKRNAN